MDLCIFLEPCFQKSWDNMKNVNNEENALIYHVLTSALN